MKRLILSALLLTGMAVSASTINYPGTFEGTISHGVIRGKCIKSTQTCWSYDTDTHRLTIYLQMGPVILPNATEPVLDTEDFWNATYQE